MFQLDPLMGEHAPPTPNTIRQGTVARVLQQAVTDVLICPDVDSELRGHQVEVTEVSANYHSWLQLHQCTGQVQS